MNYNAYHIFTLRNNFYGSSWFIYDLLSYIMSQLAIIPALSPAIDLMVNRNHVNKAPLMPTSAADGGEQTSRRDDEQL